MHHVYLIAWKHSSEPLIVRSDIVKLPFKIGGVGDLHAVVDEIVEKHLELKTLGGTPEIISFSFFGFEMVA